MSTNAPHPESRSGLARQLRQRWRWLTPLLALAVFAGAGGVVAAFTNAADAALKPRSVPSLISDVRHANLASGSGTIVQTSDLGLPALPDVATAGGSNLASLLTGTHTLRFWYGGPKQLRLALLSEFGETDLVRDGSSLWQWTSSSKSATKWTLPADSGTKEHAAMPGLPSASATPPEVAKKAIGDASDSTSIAAGPATTVAGRKAYQLIVTPKSDTTLIRSVQIAIDGETHIPTRVAVYAKGKTDPVFEIAFSSFDTGKPPASVFAFNPPPGTKVTTKSLTDLSGHSMGRSMARDHGKLMPKGRDGVRVVGKGWDSVLVAKAPQAQAGLSKDKTLGTILKKLPTVSGSWGSGHLFQGTAFSALLTADGRIAVGAVPPNALYAALTAK